MFFFKHILICICGKRFQSSFAHHRHPVIGDEICCHSTDFNEHFWTKFTVMALSAPTGPDGPDQPHQWPLLTYPHPVGSGAASKLRPFPGPGPICHCQPCPQSHPSPDTISPAGAPATIPSPAVFSTFGQREMRPLRKPLPHCPAAPLPFHCPCQPCCTLTLP